jgi:NADH-quinone oxidoreductase subunit N
MAAISGQTFIALLPELITTGFLILVLMVGVFGEKNVGLVTGLAALGSLAVFGSAAALLAVGFEGSYFGGGYVVDGFALYFKLIVSGSAFFAVLAAARWSGNTGDAPEYLTLILSVVVGATLLVSMRDLFGIFLALELATIPSYAMVAFDRSRRESAEGGMKYLITGVIASSVLLYGIVLIYGVSGSATLSDVAETFTGGLTPVALLGLVFLISGFAFKISRPRSTSGPGRLPGRPYQRRRLPLRRPEGGVLRCPAADTPRRHAGGRPHVDDGDGLSGDHNDVCRQPVRP